ncbi:translation initiation factor IF-2-like [Schistocerca cancellata]|uniref:translation initiation factor IF-2-like n=1 Tax=Schistocerca cancellata TaxID=274614 RepID=UPI0021179A9B|nr:translation initiation factor IF-2-like [Schistocerca cancellata]
MAYFSTLIAGACLLILCPTNATAQDRQDAETETTTMTGDQDQTSPLEGSIPGRPIDFGGLLSGLPIFGGGFGPLRPVGGGMRPWMPIGGSMNGGGVLPGWPTSETTSGADTAEAATASSSRAGETPHADSRHMGSSPTAAHGRAAKGRKSVKRARGRRG